MTVMQQNQDYEEFVHSHCISCIRVHCKERDACKVIVCKFACGLHYHECKEEEHVDLCPNVKVACINKVNGCPLLLPRSQLGIHLEDCPASVVCCTMEWNRWPMYSRERRQRIPFTETNVHARYGQLDVALALRDQRVLNCALKMPGRHRALRNTLTKKYPAMPFVDISDVDKEENDSSEAALLHMSDDDSDAPWHVAKNPPGLQRSIYNGLFWSARRAANNLSATLNLLMAEGDIDYLEEFLAAEQGGLLDHYQRADDVVAAASAQPAENAAHSGNIYDNEFNQNVATAANVPENCEQLLGALGNGSVIEAGCDSGDNCVRKGIIGATNCVASCGRESCVHSKAVGSVELCNSAGASGTACELLVGNDSRGSCSNGNIDSGETSVTITSKMAENTNKVTLVASVELNDNRACQHMAVDGIGNDETNSSTYEDAPTGDLAVSVVNGEFDGLRAYCRNHASACDARAAEPLCSAIAQNEGEKSEDVDVTSPKSEESAVPTYHRPQVIQYAFVVSIGNTTEEAATSSAVCLSHSTQPKGANGPLCLNVQAKAEECGYKNGYQSVYTDESANGKHVSWYQVTQVPSSPEAVKLQNILGLDLSLELLPCYQTKPQAMYTFRCAQVFRRREYPWHFQNVHGDIHSGLDGWLEYRCPLANCGCTYSQRRFRPDGSRSSVVYSVCRESFAVVKERSKSPSRKLPQPVDGQPEQETTRESAASDVLDSPVAGSDNACNNKEVAHQLHEGTPDMFTSVAYDSPVNLGTRKVKSSSLNSLLSLPLEVLRHIASLLDSFSLGCLALTCRQLRDVCGSLLQDHGLVVMTWKRQLDLSGRSRWIADGKKWLFSTAFEAVPRWQFEDNVHMNEHLKVCPFMQRTVHTQPIKLAGMREAAAQFSSPHPDVARVISRINKHAALHGPSPIDDNDSPVDYSQF